MGLILKSYNATVRLRPIKTPWLLKWTSKVSLEFAEDIPTKSLKYFLIFFKV